VSFRCSVDWREDEIALEEKRESGRRYKISRHFASYVTFSGRLSEGFASSMRFVLGSNLKNEMWAYRYKFLDFCGEGAVKLFREDINTYFRK
jgi:hypothetical protein